MRRLKHRDLVRRVEQAIIELAWFLDPTTHGQIFKALTCSDLATSRSRALADRANSDVDEAQRAISYDSDGRGGNELTGPEAHVDRRIVTTTSEDGTVVVARDANGQPIVREDLTHQRMTQLLDELDVARQSAVAARVIAGQLITSRDERDRRTQSSVAAANPTAGYGHCGNCGRLCPGTRHDRIKSDRCSPGCYEYRIRYGVERPRGLWPNG